MHDRPDRLGGAAGVVLVEPPQHLGPGHHPGPPHQPLVDAGTNLQGLVQLEQLDLPGRRCARVQPRPMPVDAVGAVPRREAVAEPAVDRRFGGEQVREHDVARGEVRQLGRHQRAQHAPARPVGADPDPGDPGHRQPRAAGNRQLRVERARRADQVRVERPDRAARLVRPGRALPVGVVARRHVQARAEEVTRRAVLVVAQDPDPEVAHPRIISGNDEVRPPQFAATGPRATSYFVAGGETS